MCGIAGVLGKGRVSVPAIQRMTSALVHRGPDEGDHWIDENAAIALGHRRLSIVDPTSSGRQPMKSACGRFILTFNGEIYNHTDIRKKLRSDFGVVQWRGHSDSETLVEAISRWGVEKVLSELNGMFAFAVWDRTLATLTLARDRLGEKPLYYGWRAGAFIFGSELKALKGIGIGFAEIDRPAVASFLHQGFVSDGACIFKGVSKLPPATFLEVSSAKNCNPMPKRYWALGEPGAMASGPIAKDSKKLINTLDDLINDSISKRLMSDVPLGAFLSGGCDSSLVSAIIASQSRDPIETFSVGFDDIDFDESSYAETIGKYLGTNHHTMKLTPSMALDCFERLGKVYDEPFADSSQLPMLAVSKLAAESVKVVLSGDGGDELFCGYDRYVIANRLRNLARFIPTGWADAMVTGSRYGLANGYQNPRFFRSRFRRVNRLRDDVFRIAEAVAKRDPSAFYQNLIYGDFAVVNELMAGPAMSEQLFNWGKIGKNFTEAMMYQDQSIYLPGDILTKLDRATMAYSIEGRVPLLDHRIVEFSWALPLGMKLKNGSGKWILKEVLKKYVPDALFDRPKKGFSVPIERWLKGPLKEWAEDHLNSAGARNNDFIRHDTVMNMWQQYLSGERRWHTKIWNALVFYNWEACREI